METLEIKAALSGKHLEALRFQMLNESHGTRINRSTMVFCDGEFKALFLKAEQDNPISYVSYGAALHALSLLNFSPASHSRRAAVKQKAVGGEMVLGFMGGRKPDWEDIFRAAHRDHFAASFWLVPFLVDSEKAMAKWIPEYYDFHVSQAKRLVRPKGERIKTLGAVENIWERKMIRDWDKKNRYYLFPGSVAFSTLTLNQSISFAAHRDGHNVPKTMSCLSAFGAWRGGGLCFPRLGLTFEVGPRDLLISDTNIELHGNVGGIFGNRYSIVAYLHSSLITR